MGFRVKNLISVRIFIFFLSANNNEIVEKMEELLVKWNRQIELVLVESEQIRRESYDVGPNAELVYWKCRMTKFNS